jgi:D-alanine-D-alanine ligase
MDKLTLALISGGTSSERQVSLASGGQVYEALDKEKYEIRRYDPKTDLGKLIADAPKIDIALIILHGPMGEDGTIQGMLDLLGIPYQGSGVLGSALAMNKLAAKHMYEKAGLPMPPYTALRKGDGLDVDRIIAHLGLPIVVKPAVGGSSIGMSIVNSKETFQEALDKAFAHGPSVILESFISGVELTSAIIGNDELTAFPLVEIIPDKNHAFFDYEAKYTPGLTTEICPARIDEELTQRAQAFGKAAHAALFCRGYSRTDMILRGRDLFVIETNTIPGMTQTSLLPKSAQTAGITFTRLLDMLIELSLADHQKRQPHQQ